MRTTLLAIVGLGLLALPSAAQFNDKWAAFSPAPAALPSGPTLSDDDHETDLDWGDLDNDGDLDLYFGDHDTGTSLFGALQPAFEDLDDRLLVNDGNGYFSDATIASLSLPMVQSGFCNSVELVDINQDGAVDILKQVTDQAPEVVSIAYNDASRPGLFSQLTTGSPPASYFINTGDLNKDGRLDLAITSNADDSVLINLGNLSDGTVDWSAPQPVQFLSGGEAVGFFGLTYSSNNLIADLDGDGWDELLIADVDVEISLYDPAFRLHLYHNQGGTPGASLVDLLEQRASPADTTWVGAHGLLPEDLRWTHDVAVFDVDGDGSRDLVLSRREGTQVWLQTNPPHCQQDPGFGGELVLEVCGGDLASGNDALLRLFAGAPMAPVFLAIGPTANPTAVLELGVTVVPYPPTTILTQATDASGELSLTVPGGGGPVGLVAQAFQLPVGGLPLASSNAIGLQFLP